MKFIMLTIICGELKKDHYILLNQLESEYRPTPGLKNQLVKWLLWDTID